MMVSTRGRYALRILIDIAEHETDGADGFVALKSVSERQDISQKYMEAIVAELAKAGFLESRRGKAGGYRLSRGTDDISVGSVLRLTEGTLAPVACMENGGCEECAHMPSCHTLPLWQRLDELIENYLERISIRDLMEGNICREDA